MTLNLAMFCKLYYNGVIWKKSTTVFVNLALQLVVLYSDRRSGSEGSFPRNSHASTTASLPYLRVERLANRTLSPEAILKFDPIHVTGVARVTRT